MLKEIQETRISRSSGNSRRLYKYFQKKYCLGIAGIVGSVSIASLSVTNVKPLSIMMVAPSGNLKSQVTEKLHLIFPENTIIIPSRFTPYGLSERIGKSRLANRTWIDNDMVRTFDGLNPIKIAEVVGWLSEMMSEGKSGSATARDTFLECRMNFLGNIALVSYRDLQDKFVSSTLSERIMQFSYYVDKNKVRKKSKKDHESNPHLLQIVLEPSEVSWTKKDLERIYSISDALTTIAHYEMHSMRPDEIVTSFLTGHAKLNGRKRIKKYDFEFLESIFDHFKKVI